MNRSTGAILGLGALAAGAALLLLSRSHEPIAPTTRTDVARDQAETNPPPSDVSSTAPAAPTRPVEIAGASSTSTLASAPEPRADIGIPLEVTGRVVDGEGKPLAGARVWLIPNGRTQQAMGFTPDTYEDGALARKLEYDFGTLRLADVPSTLTDAAGAFALATRHLSERHLPNVASAVVPSPVLLVAHESFAVSSRLLEACEGPRCDAGDLALEPGVSLVGRVLDDAGKPVAGALVAAHPTGEPQPPRSSDPDAPALWVPELLSVRTGADGRWQLPGLRPGGVTLVLRERDHVLTRLEIEAARGESLPGDVVMPRGGVIEGTVTDRAGKPIGGAEVRVTDREITASWYSDMSFPYAPGDDSILDEWETVCREEQHERVITDASGRFHLGDLERPNYTLYARAPRHEPAKVRDVATGDRGAAMSLEKEALLKVRVVDDVSGEPVAGAELEATRRALASHAGQGEQSLVVLTGEEAGAVLGGAPGPGEFVVRCVGTLGTTLRARAAGHASVQVVAPGQRAGTRGDFSVHLPRESVLGGHVRDRAGRPVAGAEVSFSPPGMVRMAFPLAETDDQGHWRVTELSPDTVALHAWASGFAESEPIVVTIAAATVRDDVDIVLPTGGRIHGSLLDADGSGIAGVTVRLDIEPFGEFKFSELSERFQDSATTDESGAYAFTDLQARRYQVAAGRAGSVVVDLAEGEDRDVTFNVPRAAVVRGRVTSGGKPVVEASLRVEQVSSPLGGAPGYFPRTPVNADGEYEITLGSAGEYELQAVRDNAPDSPPRTVVVAAGESAVADFELATGELNGRAVLDAGGEPVPKLTLSLCRDRNEEVAWVYTSEDGRFAFHHLPADTYWLQSTGHQPTERDGYKPVFEPLTAGPFVLTEGATLEIPDVVVCGGSRLTGTVRNSSGVPVKDNVWVSVVRIENGAVVPRMRTSSTLKGHGTPSRRTERPSDTWDSRRTRSGTYVLYALPPGDYRVLAGTRHTMEQIRDLGTPVTLGEHETKTVDLTAGP
jgi:protocatechuate 3,4-dioxygenase beta subunit